MSSMPVPAEFLYPTPPSGADETTVLATEAWGRVARLFLSQQAKREAIAAELGIGFGDVISLFHLRPDAGVAQRDLAEQWSCDPSWVTNRIDHLEDLGLVERVVSTQDRRVKEVWLTPSGRSARDRALAAFGTPPPALAELDLDDLRVLADLLAKLRLPEPGDVSLPAPPA
jgi:DNA-binding MarR family transcriptional regulator